jgi:CHRD domain
MRKGFVYAMAGAFVLGLAGCGMMPGSSEGSGAKGEHVTLTGKGEVPPNDSAASGMGMVTVAADGAVKVEVKVTGMTATAAHIHMAAAGANGPVIVPLEKQGTDTFVSKADAKMTAEQLAAYKAGKTYLNVHSAKAPAGEIRAQLKGS